MIQTQQPILVAVSSNWREIAALYQKENLPVIMASSKDEAFQIMDTRQFGAIVIMSDWAIDNLESASFIERKVGSVPTLTLITRTTIEKFGFNQVIDKVYLSAIHQFCTEPFDKKELVSRLYRAIEAFNAGTVGN